MRQALLIALLAVGCTVSTGRHGKLGFGYRGADAVLPGSLAAPVAVGEEVVIEVFAPRDPEAGEQNYTTLRGHKALSLGRVEAIDVDEVTSSAPDVLEVARVEGAHIRVRGLAGGASRLRVETSRGSDTIEVRVAETAYVEIDHPTWRQEEATGPGQTVLLAGGTVWLSVTRKSSSGRRLVGYGAADAVTIEPAEGAEILGEDSIDLLALRPSTPGRLTLTPVSGTALALEVVALDAVARLTLGPQFDEEGERAGGREDVEREATVDQTVLLQLVARLEDGRRALGLDGLAEVTSATPSVCEVAPLQTIFEDRVLAVEEGVFALAPRAAGECVVDASLGDRSAQLTVTVRP